MKKEDEEKETEVERKSGLMEQFRAFAGQIGIIEPDEEGGE